jgi:hypothetical protein
LVVGQLGIEDEPSLEINVYGIDEFSREAGIDIVERW